MLGAFVAGRYAGAWGSTPIGMTKQGFELEFQFKQENIEESDLFGLQIIDLILRGCDCYVSMMLKEWNAGSKALLWALGGGTLGTIFTTGVPCATFASSLAQSLVFTVTANTAAVGNPNTLTAPGAFPAPSFNPKTLLDSRLRELPIRMIMLPYTSGGSTLAFSTS